MRELLQTLVLLLAPFAPYLAAELWEELGGEGAVLRQPWPKSDPGFAKEDEIEIPVQINGKLVSVIRVPAGSDAKAIEAAALAEEKGKVANCRQNSGEGDRRSGTRRQPGREIEIGGEVISSSQSGAGSRHANAGGSDGLDASASRRGCGGSGLALALRYPVSVGLLDAIAACADDLTPEESGLSSIDAQNPWIAAAQLSRAWWQYQPLIAHELRWIAPVAALAWIVISAMGATWH